MSASLVVLASGIGSLLVTIPRQRRAPLSWAWTALCLVLGVAGLGVQWWACLALVGVAQGWGLSIGAAAPGAPRRGMPAGVGRAPHRTIVATACLVVTIAVALGLDTVLTTGPTALTRGWTEVRSPALAGVPLALLVATVGVIALMGPASNLLTASTLAAVRGTEGATPPDHPVLRGGRVIGPLERLLIVVLGLAGALPVIAALLAAKGIVRFPEISRDSGLGAKAEEFLIGSMTSWSLACAATLFLALLRGA